MRPLSYVVTTSLVCRPPVRAQKNASNTTKWSTSKYMVFPEKLGASPGAIVQHRVGGVGIVEIRKKGVKIGQFAVI